MGMPSGARVPVAAMDNSCSKGLPEGIEPDHCHLVPAARVNSAENVLARGGNDAAIAGGCRRADGAARQLDSVVPRWLVRRPSSSQLAGFWLAGPGSGRRAWIW